MQVQRYIDVLSPTEQVCTTEEMKGFLHFKQNLGFSFQVESSNTDVQQRLVKYKLFQTTFIFQNKFRA